MAGGFRGADGDGAGRRWRSVVAVVVGLLAPAGGAWLFWREGGWDTYRTPLFWPFVFASGLMVMFSSSDAPAEPQSWRGLVARTALVTAVVVTGFALLASRNPINGIQPRDIVALALLALLLVAAAGAATAWGERICPGGWIKTAWCLAASLLFMALIPRLVLLLH